VTCPEPLDGCQCGGGRLLAHSFGVWLSSEPCGPDLSGVDPQRLALPPAHAGRAHRPPRHAGAAAEGPRPPLPRCLRAQCHAAGQGRSAAARGACSFRARRARARLPSWPEPEEARPSGPHLAPPVGGAPREGLRPRRARLPRLWRQAPDRRLHRRGDRGRAHPRSPRPRLAGPAPRQSPGAAAAGAERPRPELPQFRTHPVLSSGRAEDPCGGRRPVTAFHGLALGTAEGVVTGIIGLPKCGLESLSPDG
jgi:hypothetical protein